MRLQIIAIFFSRIEGQDLFLISENMYEPHFQDFFNATECVNLNFLF